MTSVYLLVFDLDGKAPRFSVLVIEGEEGELAVEWSAKIENCRAPMSQVSERG